MSDAFPLRMIGWSRLSTHQSKAVIAVLAILLTLAVGYVDYATGTGISMSAYYLVPLALAAWYLGPRFAVALMALGMAVWVPANIYNAFPSLTGPAAVA